jgi:hypothetical protein
MAIHKTLFDKTHKENDRHQTTTTNIATNNSNDIDKRQDDKTKGHDKDNYTTHNKDKPKKQDTDLVWRRTSGL